MISQENRRVLALWGVARSFALVAVLTGLVAGAPDLTWGGWIAWLTGIYVEKRVLP